MAQCKSAVCEMAALTEEAMALTVKSAAVFDRKEVERILQIEDIMDTRQDEINIYLTKLSAKTLSEKDSHLVGKFGRCIIDFERISDYLKGIAITL